MVRFAHAMDDLELELRDQIREYITQARAAADRADEALASLNDGDSQTAHKVFLSVHQLDAFRGGILDAFSREMTPP